MLAIENIFSSRRRQHPLRLGAYRLRVVVGLVSVKPIQALTRNPQ